VKAVVKAILLQALRALGVFALGRLVTRQAVMIVGWHGVSLGNEHLLFPSLFIRAEELERRLRFLTRHYTVIDLDEFTRQRAQGRFEPHQVVLTFDDGFHNFSAVAAPLLREAGVTATNYLVSQPLLDDRPNYRMLVRSIARGAAVVLGGTALPRGRTLSSGDLDKKARLEAAVLADFDTCPTDRVEQEWYVTQLAARLGVDVGSQLDARLWHVMKRGDVKALADEGFGMQLHTHRHLNVVDHADRVADEVRECRSIVEGVTGKSATHFCYPAGLWQRAAWTPLEEAGVVTATTTMLGPNFVSTPPLALRRVLNGEDRSQLEFEFEMSNIRWLWAVLLGRATWATPSEKLVPFQDVQVPF
jgi:peptidoglycan/xylan/chitin deacetylase (PgdA/CDA1 family)